MNRLHHLSQTLPFNLSSTQSYPQREFVILNYGSTDGLDQWARESLMPYIEAGILNYYHTTEPKYFCATHAKNIAHKLASGDILCNIDCDNYVLPGFAEFLASSFAANDKIIVVSDSTDRYGNNGCCGKIAVKRADFYSVNGYDEAQKDGWGWDDTNFQFRARMHNELEMVYCPKELNLAIDHPNEERTKNYKVKDIEKTSAWSQQHLRETALTKQYVVNKNHHWGKARVRKNFGVCFDLGSRQLA